MSFKIPNWFIKLTVFQFWASMLDLTCTGTFHPLGFWFSAIIMGRILRRQEKDDKK